MNHSFIIFISVFLLLYGSINYYVGIRIHKALIQIWPTSHSGLYWIFLGGLSVSYIAARLLSSYIPKSFLNLLTRVGAYWLGAMFYFAFIFAFMDLLRIVDKYTGVLPEGAKNKPWGGIMVVFLVIFLLIYGTWNAKKATIQHYDINISKNAGDLNSLHVVMVSDIHLGNIVKSRELAKMVDIINGLEPDIVLFAGDIIDESIQPVIEQKMDEIFRGLKSQYGSYAVLGNHEFIGRHEDEIADYLKAGGVKVLRDEYIKIGDSFYVAGRNDIAMERFTEKPRKKLSDIFKEVDPSLPMILLDHNPKYIEESLKHGVDLQLSGHTHRGQFFPNNLITNRIYEVDWGYFSKDKFQAIISSGFGTWGPPIRIGNGSEIVDITINFTMEP